MKFALYCKKCGTDWFGYDSCPRCGYKEIEKYHGAEPREDK